MSRPTRSQVAGGVAVVHAQDVLLDDGARVEVLGDVVRGGADDLHAAIARVPVGAGAREGGQEGVVDVQDRAPDALQEVRR